MVLTAIEIIALLRGEVIPVRGSDKIQMDFNDTCDPDALCDIAEAAYERVSQIDGDNEDDE